MATETIHTFWRSRHVGRVAVMVRVSPDRVMWWWQEDNHKDVTVTKYSALEHFLTQFEEISLLTRCACLVKDEKLIALCALHGEYLRDKITEHRNERETEPQPIPMLLHCPICMARHIDEGTFTIKPHHTHACQSCGHVWRPALVPTCGVRFLPGFKNL